MLKQNPMIIVGHSFDSETFLFLLDKFKEAFSHSSLTIEEAFKEFDEYDLIIQTTKNDIASGIFELLSDSEKKNIIDLMHQMIVFKGKRFCVFPDELDNTQETVDRIYSEYFSYFDEYLPYYMVFDSNGNFDKTATFRNVDTLFLNLPQRNELYKKAYNMKKDNLDAFDYAMGLKDITLGDAVKINEIVNFSNDDKIVGFKTMNNIVLGATFEPVDKKQVPFELQKLFADYNNGMGYDIKSPNEKGLTAREKYDCVCNIMRREAEFHIRFERIHPFSDGNGRTGRIILNYHLLKQGIAPVLITNALSQDYKKAIDDYDVEGLAKMFLSSSDHELTDWISYKRTKLSLQKNGIIPNNKLAEFIDDDNMDSGPKTKSIGTLF